VSNILLVAGCNERYHEAFQPCVAALRRFANVPYQLISVGFDDYNGYTPLTHEQNYGAPPETECIQHGSFLSVVPGELDDVLIYLDGDVRMQRPFDDWELTWLANFPARAVAAGWNQTGETLAACATYIGPRHSPDELAALWGKLIYGAPSLNAGVVVARRHTWERAYSLYMAYWERAGASFAHQARQQWLMCWTWAALGLTTEILSWHFHAHGHFGYKPGMELRDGQIYADGKLAAFRHKC
jgi:hypothetical protein